MKSQIGVDSSRPRKKSRSSSPACSRKTTAAVDGAAVAVAAAAYASTTPLTSSLVAVPTIRRRRRRSQSSLLLASIAILTSIFIIQVTFFAEALNSPTPNNENSMKQKSNDNDNPDDRVLDDKAENIIRTIDSSGEDSISSLSDNENAYHDDKSREDSSTSSSSSTTYESKTRKQRQKPRQKQRLRQEIIAVATQQDHQNDIVEQQQQQQQKHHHSSQAEHDAYMRWCEKVLGIQSVVEIAEFEYPDHLQIYLDGSDINSEQQYQDESQSFEWLKPYSTTNNNNGENTFSYGSTSGEEEEAELPPTKLVRGLAAKHDIQTGDIVISIPLYSLLSVPTTIDHDPVLSRILGPSARREYGWNDTAEYEIALLVIAVLYHRSLGKDSPLSHYVDILLGTSTESFPFLWNDGELRERTSAGDGVGEGVRNLARGIRRDLYQMYDEVMGALAKERAEWFAPPDGYVFGNDDVENAVEWVYSYENFQWAFALVISRHHYLPIQDFDDGDDNRSRSNKKTETAVKNIMQETLSTVSEVVPPANQPTDSWVDLAKNEERVVEDENEVMGSAASDDDNMGMIQSMMDINKHSFLAPLADLINFGPPCLTGSYNAEEHMFELIATCPFTKGQEVTFYYSSDCSDVIIANFGFLHPLVPQCAPPEDWEKKSDEWKDETKMRDKELWEVYRKMDLLKEELAGLESQLVSCGCEDGEKKQQQQQQQQRENADSIPTSTNNSPESPSHKLRNGHALRQDFGVRGRINEQEEATREMMEELG